MPLYNSNLLVIWRKISQLTFLLATHLNYHQVQQDIKSQRKSLQIRVLKFATHLSSLVKSFSQFLSAYHHAYDHLPLCLETYYSADLTFSFNLQNLTDLKHRAILHNLLSNINSICLDTSNYYTFSLIIIPHPLRLRKHERRNVTHETRRKQFCALHSEIWDTYCRVPTKSATSKTNWRCWEKLEISTWVCKQNFVGC